MKVLVACEYSGTVRDAFNAKGHQAFSCDLLPTDVPGRHYTGDVFDIIHQGWDLMIAHPPCTYLSVSGMHWTARGLRDPQLTEDALQFVKRLMDAPIPQICIENPVSVISSRIRKPDQIIHPWMFGDDASKKTCLWLKNFSPLRVTNPKKVVPPIDYQLVTTAMDCEQCECCEEPYCLIHNIHYSDCPCMGPTEDGVTYVQQDGVLFGTKKNPAPKLRWGNQTGSGQNKLPPSKDRWKIRSKTYSGIAQAMAEQWG